MSKQPTQRQADDIGIASGMQRKPNEFSLSWAPPRRVLVKKNNVLFVCRPENPIGWLCGNCHRGRLGFDPKDGKRCGVCHATVKYTSNDRVPRNRS